MRVLISYEIKKYDEAFVMLQSESRSFSAFMISSTGQSQTAYRTCEFHIPVIFKA